MSKRIKDCPVFQAASDDLKQDIIKKIKAKSPVCSKCLSWTHKSEDCRWNTSCSKCNEVHINDMCGIKNFFFCSMSSKLPWITRSMRWSRQSTQRILSVLNARAGLINQKTVGGRQIVPNVMRSTSTICVVSRSSFPVPCLPRATPATWAYKTFLFIIQTIWHE